MTRYMGFIDPTGGLIAKVEALSAYGRLRLAPILNFSADSLEEASTFFVAYYHHLYGLDLEPGEFSVIEQ